MDPASLQEWERRLAAHVAELPVADPAHDSAHVARVVVSAGKIGAEEGADPWVLVPAAWLHDCVILPKGHPDSSRSSLLAAEAGETWLRENGFPSGHLPAVRHAIEAHSFSAGIEPRSLEARVLQDADRLDALGAIGVARCFVVGGARGRPIYCLEDPFCDQRNADDSRSTLDHFYTKLLRLPGLMRTPAGRREAERRLEFMKSFLQQLREEIG